jgi:hypothetical protein
MAVTPTYTVPEDYKSGLKDVLAEAKNIYETQKGLGYQTYGGPRIAGFSPDELAAMQGIAGLVGTGQQYFNPAAALTLGQTQRFDPATAAQYMSPYQQAVVDVEKREAVRQAQVPMQQIRQQAAGAGGYGGSRQAILEAEAQRNLQGRLGDIQTRGSQAAYETGLRSFEAQKERERAAASGLAALGQAAPRQALTELTALSGIGEAQRGMTQTGLDIAYQEAEAQKQFPYQALGQYQSTLYGYPYQSYGQFEPTAKPSSSQNLAGILGAVGKVGSSFGFFNSGGRVAYQSSGGLSGMVQKLAAGMGVGSEDTSPLAQAVEEKTTKQKLLESLQELTTGRKDLVSQLKESQEKEKAAREEQLAKLEKQAGGVSYISDLLLGYAAADPEAGLGAQLAGAATYAEEQRPDIAAAKLEIERAVSEGRISVAEAELALKKLETETLKDIYESESEGVLDTGAFNAIRKSAATRLGFVINPTTGDVQGPGGKPLTEDQAAALSALELKGMQAYETSGKLIDAQKAITGTITTKPVIPDNNMVPVTPGSKPGDIAQGLIQDLE